MSITFKNSFLIVFLSVSTKNSKTTKAKESFCDKGGR